MLQVLLQLLVDPQVILDIKLPVTVALHLLDELDNFHLGAYSHFRILRARSESKNFLRQVLSTWLSLNLTDGIVRCVYFRLLLRIVLTFSDRRLELIEIRHLTIFWCTHLFWAAHLSKLLLFELLRIKGRH